MSDPGDAPHLSLIVPCYNGEARLLEHLTALATFVAEQPFRAELILVDDGSAPPAARVLAFFAAGKRGVRLIRQERNFGKGASVVRGMLAATGRYRVFMDHDLAFPPGEVHRILGDLEAGADVAIACRVLPESRYLMSPTFFHYLYTRHLMSRLFNAVTRAVLLRGILDSQAGLKGFTAHAAETIFPRTTIPGFGFDLEVLFIAQRRGFTVRQTAVHFRYDAEPTTVRFIESAWRMILDLARVRLNDWRGRYG